jgi:uncharacterized protein YndB with AHSA1/START domain
MTAQAALAPQLPLKLDIVRRFAAPPEKLFDAWTKTRGKWWGPAGFTLEELVIDLRPGGSWRQVMRAADGGLQTSFGTYRDVQRPHRLVMTHRWDNQDGSRSPETQIIINFVAVEGGTEMHFEQTGFEREAPRDGHVRGWTQSFDAMDSMVCPASEPARPVLIVSRRFAAPQARVFDAWLDPAMVGKFLFVTDTGVMERVEVNPCVGGRLLVVERRGDVSAEHWGRYIEIGRPYRIAFEFADTYMADSTRVTVTFEPDGDGCMLVLRHELDPAWVAVTEKARQGWTGIIEKLARALDA